MWQKNVLPILFSIHYHNKEYILTIYVRFLQVDHTNENIQWNIWEVVISIEKTIYYHYHKLEITIRQFKMKVVSLHT